MTMYIRTLKAPYETESVRWKREYVPGAKCNKAIYSYAYAHNKKSRYIFNIIREMSRRFAVVVGAIFEVLFCKSELTLRLLMSYIYGAPSKARNANVVYIWTYVWQR